MTAWHKWPRVGAAEAVVNKRQNFKIKRRNQFIFKLLETAYSLGKVFVDKIKDRSVRHYCITLTARGEIKRQLRDKTSEI